MAKPATPTVTLKHLAAAIAEDHEMAKKQSEAILNDLVAMMVKHLKKGDRIRIGGFGILQFFGMAEQQYLTVCLRKIIHCGVNLFQ